ncbi:MAG: hypothetical protein ACTSRU_20495 [Candidatus Hodarchaeales archaeon]
MAYPDSKTNATDNVTDIIAAHLNNLEDRVGITGSVDPDSIEYRLGGLRSGEVAVRVGDIKPSFNGAGYGWLILNGDTIGNAASGADQANDNYQDLFDFFEATLGLTPSDTWANGGVITMPDGRGRFLKGKEAVDDIGDVGGGNTADLSHTHTVAEHVHDVTAHSHSVSDSGELTTNTVASHTHTYSGTTGFESDVEYSEPSSGAETSANSSHTHAYSGTSSSSGGHSHTIATHNHSGATGENSAIDTGAATPVTDSALSASADITPSNLAVNHLIKY